MTSLFSLAKPLLMRMDPETAHGLALRFLRSGLGPRCGVADPLLRQTVWGIDFPNPLGLAAGFDKQAEALPGLFRIGFGFVEAGTVTPRPQGGNPRPRVFRDISNRSVINRMGFPGAGQDVFLRNVADYRRRYGQAGVLGVNIGINKDSTSPPEDYAQLLAAVTPQADYVTVNISSPNTPGLRDLQQRNSLDALLSALFVARAAASRRVPLLVKVSPDMAEGQRADIAQLVLQHGVDGLIVSNTTTVRPAALTENLRQQAGGLSGALLAPAALQALRDFYRLTEGRVPLVGVGGISSAADAYARIRAGASLVQVYTALVFDGPALVPRMLMELAALLRRDGFSSVAAAVGFDARTGQAGLKAVG